MENRAIIPNLEELDNIDLNNAVHPLTTLTGPLLEDPTPLFESQVLTMLRNLRGDMQSMGTRVTNLEATRTQSAPASQTQSVTSDASTPKTQSVTCLTPPLGEVQNSTLEQSSTTLKPGWGERPAVEQPDFSLIPVFDDGDEDENTEGGGGVKLFKVSQKTETFLKTSFSTAAPNQVRRQWRDKFGAPNTTYTACPSMDKIVKGRLSAATKSRDKQLARQQALLLDAVGPITYILEEATKGQLTQKSAMEAAQTALKLMGNASMQANRERRKNAIQCMNPRLGDMAEDDELYKAAAPALFGEGFSKKAKERDDELKCLNHATGKSSSGPGRYGNRDTQFFRRGHSHNPQFHGSGQSHFRGRGRGGHNRHHPYRNSGWARKPEEPRKPSQ